MKQIFTFLSAIMIGTMGMTQAFQSDFSSWASGVPTDWDGTKSNLSTSDITEVTTGATYGTSMANLIRTASSHKRFTTQSFSVVGGTTYDVSIYVSGLQGHIRSSHYDLTNSSYGSYTDYDSLEVLSLGSFIVINQSITVAASCTDIEYIMSIRNTDANGFDVDSVSITAVASQPANYSAHTINEIQNSTSGASPFEDSLVITSGVVTALNTGTGYWMQDGDGAWSGVYVYDNSNTPSIGDSITIEGQVVEYYDLTQIESIASYVLNPSPSVLPTAFSVSSVAVQTMEEYEGVLIEVLSAECTNANAGFGMWVVNTNVSSANDSLLVDDDLFAYTPTLGTVYGVTGIGHYSYSNYKILPRDVNDIIGATPPTPPTEVSIYDIQYTTDASGDSEYKDSIVTTKGVVTGVFQIGSGAGTFFIQDGNGAWNGLYIYESGTTVAIGDSVSVTGTILEYYTYTEMGSVSDITILNSGNASPTPAIITGLETSNEDYEGVLVTVENGTNTVVTDQYGVWTMNDGNDVFVDDDLMPASFTSTVGNVYTVAGVRHLSFSEVKILPRELADIITTGINSIDENGVTISLYPNPATNNFVVSGIENGNYAIYTMNGSIVSEGNLIKNSNINISNYSPGIYMIKLTSNGETSTHKLIIK